MNLTNKNYSIKVKLLATLLVILTCTFLFLLLTEIAFFLTNSKFYFRSLSVNSDGEIQRDFEAAKIFTSQKILLHLNPRENKTFEFNLTLDDKSKFDASIILKITGEKPSFKPLTLNVNQTHVAANYYPGQNRSTSQILNVDSLHNGQNKVEIIDIAEGINLNKASLILLPARESEGKKGLYRENPFRKKSSRLRIITIGGSTTYGLGVSQKETWPSKLQAYLESEFPNKFEVINLGRLGGSLEEFILNYDLATTRYLSREILAQTGNYDGQLENSRLTFGWKDLEPDLVLAAPIVNDTAPDYLVLSENSANNLTTKFIVMCDNFLQSHFPFNKSALSYYVHILRYSEKSAPETSKEDISDDIIKIIKTGLQERLNRFLAQWRGKSDLRLLSFPILFNSSDSDKTLDIAAFFWNLSDIKSLNREFQYLPPLSKIEEEVFQGSSVAYYQILTDLKSLKFNERVKYYIDSIHLNEKGYSLLAGSIAESLNLVFQELVGLPDSVKEQNGADRPSNNF